MTRVRFAVLAAGFLSAVALPAQSRQLEQGRAQPPGQGQPRPANRAAMEAQVRLEAAQRVRILAQLTDSQFTKLLGVNQQLAPRAQQLTQRETRTRMAVAEQLGLGDAANQDSIAVLVDQLLGFSQDRLNLVRDEQRRLEAFLSPKQRAQYMVLQEQVHRSIEERIAQNAARRGGGLPGAGPGRQGARGGPPGARGQQGPPPGTPPPGTPPPGSRPPPK